jgi:ribonuclease HI
MNWECFTDGACRRSNPGVTACAFALYKDGTLVESQGFFLGKLFSNNYAEYQGLLKALEYLEYKALRNVRIFCDSKLVVEQVCQRWNVNSEELRPIMIKAYALLVRGAHMLNHCKGHSGVEGNELADFLCNAVLDEWENNDASKS